MRLIFAVVLILGVGLAGFAVFMAQGRIQQYQSALAQQQAENQKTVALEDVYVTTRPMLYGQRITEKDVKLVPFPVTSIPEGAFRVKADLFPDGDEKARYVVRQIEDKEVVMAVKITEPGEDAGVSSRLLKGMRAFAIRVDVASGVSGFLRPGDRVDIYWSGGGAEGTGTITKLIEVGVKLIAIDQISDTGRNNPLIARTVTVELTPQQVGALAQAQTTGRLSLSLVGAQDQTVADATDVDQRKLLGIQEKKVVEVQRAQVCTIRTRRGSEVVEIPIACSN